MSGFNFRDISIQPKLKISQPDDPYEKEADRVSYQIMRMSNPNIKSNSDSQINRKCSSCGMKEDEFKIHRKPQSLSNNLETSDKFSNQITNTSGGQPLDSSTKQFMENKLNYDFSEVRIHNDSESHELSDSINARAFTVGTDIFFAKNESVSDKRLTVHELVHVIQNESISNSQVILKRSPQKKNIEFEGDEIIAHSRTLKGGDMAGVNIPREIDLLVGRLKTQFDIIARAWLGAVNNFATYMNFPDTFKAKADYMKTIFNFASTKILDFAISKIPGQQVVSIAYDLIKEMIKEAERSQKAQGEIKIRDFIIDYRTSLIDNVLNKIATKLSLLNAKISGPINKKISQDKYEKEWATPKSVIITKKDGSTESVRRIAGFAAQFLNRIDREISSLEKIQPKVSDFLKPLVEKWANLEAGSIKSKGGGAVYVDGRIYINIDVVLDGSNIETNTKARIAALESGKVADAFNKLMKERGETLNDLSLPKIVRIDIEDEVSGFNDYYYVQFMYHNNPKYASNLLFAPKPLRKENTKKANKIGQRVFDFMVNNRLSKINHLEPY